MAGDEPGRLDAERLEVLRRWGRGLGEDARDEVRAAGRAIGMLIEEIERLHIELWHARVAVQTQDSPLAEEAPYEQAGEELPPEPAPANVDNIPVALLARVRGLFTARRAPGAQRHE